jgi:hypothetical protein
MRRKMPRPPTPAGQRAATSKELPCTFDCQHSETLNQEQDDDRSSVPNAHTRIVFGGKREDAQRFLGILDDRTTRFTFMVFADNENRKDKRLSRILHGTFDELFPTLVDYSRRGCGVFVTINTTNFFSIKSTAFCTWLTCEYAVNEPPARHSPSLSIASLQGAV